MEQVFDNSVLEGREPVKSLTSLYLRKEVGFIGKSINPRQISACSGRLSSCFSHAGFITLQHNLPPRLHILLRHEEFAGC